MCHQTHHLTTIYSKMCKQMCHQKSTTEKYKQKCATKSYHQQIAPQHVPTTRTWISIYIYIYLFEYLNIYIYIYIFTNICIDIETKPIRFPIPYEPGGSAQHLLCHDAQDTRALRLHQVFLEYRAPNNVETLICNRVRKDLNIVNVIVGPFFVCSEHHGNQ